MTKKELFSLGVAKSQLTSILELLDSARRNLNYAKGITIENESELIKCYQIIQGIDNLVSDLSKEKCKENKK